MIKELENFTSGIRNPFMLLSFLSLVFILLFTYVLKQQANLPFFLLLPLLIFSGVLLLICILAFIILLFKYPSRLFMQHVSDLEETIKLECNLAFLI